MFRLRFHVSAPGLCCLLLSLTCSHLPWLTEHVMLVAEHQLRRPHLPSEPIFPLLLAGRSA